MPSFGEKLKQERVKRSITLEQISISTKIGTRMLQALEEDRFNQLPGGIFNKGFVRAYARFVGLDEDQTVADYLEASGEGSPAEADAQEPILAPPPQPKEPTSSRPLPWGLFAALLLLVALSLAVWSRRQHRESPAPSLVPAAETSPSHPPATTVAAAEPNPAPLNAPPTVPAQPAKAEPSAKPASKPATNSAGNSVTPPPADTASTAPEEFTVVVLAHEDSWLSISADGNSVFADTIVGGNQRAIHARKEVVIHAGNAGALDFVFNGKKLPPQGEIGDVRTLTFGPGGLARTATTPASPQ